MADKETPCIMPLYDEDARSLVRGLIRSMSADAPVSPRVLLSPLDEAKRAFIRAADRASREEENGAALGEGYLWLLDNRPLLSGLFRSVRKALSAKCMLTSCGGIPFAYALTRKLITLYGGTLSPALAAVIIDETDHRTKEGLSTDELSLLPTLMLAALLCAMGELCREELSPSFRKKTEGTPSLPACVRSLLKLGSYDFTPVLSRCTLEELLGRDPAGLYPLETESTKALTRRRLKALAKRDGKSEYETVCDLLSCAERGQDVRSRYIGGTLVHRDPRRLLYYPLILILTGLAGGLVYAAAPFPPLLFLPLVFPLYEASHFFIDLFFSRLPVDPLYDAGRLPRLMLSGIPDDAVTLCVITSLVTEKNADRLLSRLGTIAGACIEKNVYFGLLCDLSDEKSAVTEKDGPLMERLAAGIERLNRRVPDGAGFYLFIRGRQYDAGEGVFMPWERKRGAVTELVRYLRGTDTSFMDGFPGESARETLRRVRYVVTLDADTDLGLDGIRTLVGTIHHPQNRPEVDEARGLVTRGFGILQPRIAPGLAGASATAFSRVMCGAGGTDPYGGASFDLLMTYFGVGLFCGKGIFDVDAYRAVIDRRDPFPTDRILSHDIPEGARLRAGLITDLTLTDGFPHSELAYHKRAHRWVRGDVQNLFFLLPRRGGTRLPLLARVRLAGNIRRALTPVAQLVLITASGLLPGLTPGVRGLLVFSALLPSVLPFLSDLFGLFFTMTAGRAARRFYSRGVTVGVWQSFLRMLLSWAMLAQTALLNLGAVLTSLFRMTVSHKHLLEWVTAEMAENGKETVSVYIVRHLPSASLGAVLAVFAGGGMVRFLGLAFFFMPLIGRALSKKTPASPPLSRKDREKLTLYAADIWQFFEENVTASDNFLPPDNRQFSPSDVTAHRTSPTNIGFYLLSLLNARDFGFLSTSSLCEKLDLTLSTVERLERYRGNLYNWYDTTSCEVMAPRFVSSVDSGNFAACLVTLAEGLKEYVGEDERLPSLISRVEALREGTSLAVFYRKERRLFSVGLTVDKDGNAVPDEGVYDLYMSEARTLSYLAVAGREVPSEHWGTLGRPLVSSGGYIGLASWSGTAFEYFLPPQFLPYPPGSLSREAMLFAYMAQKGRHIGRLWGTSESGFFSFDSTLSYGYRAFGVPRLALSRHAAGKDEYVFAPYAVFLMTCVSVPGALAALEALAGHGMYGKYGFYEAADYTSSRTGGGMEIVKSYMAHHLGMSFIALANACFDGVDRRRFMRDGETSCGLSLLEERIPVDGSVTRSRSLRDGRRERPMRPLPAGEAVYEGVQTAPYPRALLLSDGQASLVLTDAGHTFLVKNGLPLIESSADRFRIVSSLFGFIKRGSTVYSLTPFPVLGKPGGGYTLTGGSGELTRRLVIPEGAAYGAAVFTMRMTLDPIHRSALRVMLSSEGISGHDRVTSSLCFTPQLCDNASFEAHPAFAGLFLEASFDAENNLLLYHRRDRTGRDGGRFLAVAPADRSLSFAFDTRRVAHSRGMTGEGLFRRVASASPTGTTGACIEPFCHLQFGLSDTEPVEFLLVSAPTGEDAAETVRELRNESFCDASRRLSDTFSQLMLGAGTPSFGENSRLPALLGSLFFGRGGGGDGVSYPREALYAAGISGDDPLIAFSVDDPEHTHELSLFLRAFRLLHMAGIRAELAILYDESDRYFRPVRRALSDCLEKTGTDILLGRHGGVFLVENRESGDTAKAIRSAARALFGGASHPAAVSPPNVREILAEPPLPRPEDRDSCGFAVTGGRFADGRFIKTPSLLPSLPFSHILSGKNISTVLTHRSLGYTFCRNAQERRITLPSGKTYDEGSGERMFLTAGRRIIDLAACSRNVCFRPGQAVYEGEAAGLMYRITVHCAEALPAKMIEVSFRGEVPQDASLTFRVIGCMGRFPSFPLVYTVDEPGLIRFRPGIYDAFGGEDGFLICREETAKPILCRSVLFGGEPDGPADCAAFRLPVSDSLSVSFALGAAKRTSGMIPLVREQLAVPSAGRQAARRFAGALLPSIAFVPVRHDDRSLALKESVNLWMPYACVFSRFLARAGFYQAGGAYGFRDQLQDALMLMWSGKARPLCRAHLCRAAAWEFPEGDVLHWFHVPSGTAVRTRISDDGLWLVYAVCEYLAFTGDRGILDVPLPYRVGDALTESERERCFKPSLSPRSEWESLASHLERILDRAAARRGAHGLPLIGTGDWCDGYDRVGIGGHGESVWLALFLKLVTEAYLPCCRDGRKIDRYRELVSSLEEAVTLYGFDEESGLYRRGYDDEGRPFGVMGESACAVDLLPQAFAPLTGCGEPSRNAKAILRAFDRLYDPALYTLSLLDPPFGEDSRDLGYIRAYPPGIRENGGQYTHGALFLALGAYETACALRREGKTDEVARLCRVVECILDAADPAFRTSLSQKKEVRCAYLAEPYAPCADISTNPAHIGRAGWTQYTGTAGWFVRVVYRCVFGISFRDAGTGSPRLLVSTDRPVPYASLLDRSSLKIAENGFDLVLEYRLAEVPGLFADGRPVGTEELTPATEGTVEVHLPL